MEKYVTQVLIKEEEIEAKIKEAAKWVNKRFQDEKLVLVGLLKGCIPFFGRLMTKITCDFTMDFMVVSSYKGGIKSTGKITIVTDIINDIKDKSVLIVEDIVDSAYTLYDVIHHLQKKGPKSVSTISLLNKQAGRKINLDPDYACFEIPNEFVVGFGLDYNECLRNLPYIGVLKLP